ncbi:MAG: hypothetical protein ACOX6T_00965 [Myxococcales bacterium]|jgi:hypothetical protein
MLRGRWVEVDRDRLGRIVGPFLSGMVAFRSGRHTSSLHGADVARMTDVGLDAALAVHLSPSESVELTPRVGIGFLRRTVLDAFEPRELKGNSFNGFVGGTGRLWLSQYLGIHADVRLGFGPDETHGGIALVDGFAAQIGAGLSARY